MFAFVPKIITLLFEVIGIFFINIVFDGIVLFTFNTADIPTSNPILI